MDTCGQDGQKEAKACSSLDGGHLGSWRISSHHGMMDGVPFAIYELSTGPVSVIPTEPDSVDLILPHFYPTPRPPPKLWERTVNEGNFSQVWWAMPVISVVGGWR